MTGTTKFRMTGGYFEMGMNPGNGIVYLLDRMSPLSAAGEIWGDPPTREQLPH
jgi:hypothetical protein